MAKARSPWILPLRLALVGLGLATLGSCVADSLELSAASGAICAALYWVLRRVEQGHEQAVVLERHGPSAAADYYNDPPPPSPIARVSCASCNAVNDACARFCGACSAPILANRICTCGVENQGDDPRCKACGKDLSAAP
jgi:hypothetical protein